MMCEHPEQLVEQAIQNNARVVLDQDKHGQVLNCVQIYLGQNGRLHDSCNLGVIADIVVLAPG